MVAFSMVALIAMLGLAIDMGYVRYMQRQLQTAADNAALAGAMQIPYAFSGGQNGQTPTSITTAAIAGAAEDSFGSSVPGVTVSVCSPPGTALNGGTCPATSLSGNGSSVPVCATCVQVTITDSKVPTFFSQNFGAPKNLTLSATAVAEGSINCIYGLDSTSSTMSLQGISIFFFTIGIDDVHSACGIVDDGGLDNTINVGQAGLCAPSFEMVGSITGQTSGGCSYGGGFAGYGGHITQPYPPTVIKTPAPDPLNYLNSNPPPIPPAITSNLCSQTATPLVITGQTAYTINPGTYCGGIEIINSQVLFAPGNYVIVGTTGGKIGGISIHSKGFFGNSQVYFGAGQYAIVGGINDNDSFGSTVNYNIGGGTALFILYGGGLTLTGNQTAGKGSLASGNGVTFYNTGTGGNIGGSVTIATCPTCYGAITSYFDFSSGFCGGNCGLIAPTTGPYEGILFWQDPLNTQNAVFGANVSLNNGNIYHEGAYYFPKATANFDFDFGYGANYTLLVAKDIAWFWSFSFKNNYATLPNGSPVAQGTAVLIQ
jgi:Flp pilus assembly protein TadG